MSIFMYKKEYVGRWHCLLNCIGREKLNLSAYGFLMKVLGGKRGNNRFEPILIRAHYCKI